jgi:proteasome inhibitor subunit 1 (PI31)
MPDLGKGVHSSTEEPEGLRRIPPRQGQPSTSQPQAPPRHHPPSAQAGRYPSPDNPLSIGRRDLDPIPMNPFAPPSLFGPSRNDGMYLGPDHPIFGPGRRDPFGVGEPTGPWGGDGFLPPMGAPPGARFDPVGPGPWPNRNRGPHGDPSNDEFMPPGFDNDAHMPPPPGSVSNIDCVVYSF